MPYEYLQKVPVLVHHIFVTLLYSTRTGFADSTEYLYIAVPVPYLYRTRTGTSVPALAVYQCSSMYSAYRYTVYTRTASTIVVLLKVQYVQDFLNPAGR